MTILITDEIKSAINSFIDASGSVMEVERKTGIRNQTIGKYRSGEIKKMNERTWAVLEPFLRQYLKPDVVNIGNNAPNGRIYGHVGFFQPQGQTEENNQNSDFFSIMGKLEKKILDHEALSPEEKIKFLKILKE